MPGLDTSTRNIVIGRLKAGESQNAVARLYNVHRVTISRLLQWYQQSSSTADRSSNISAAQDHTSGTSPEKPDRDSKKNSIKCPRSATNIGTDSLKSSP